MTKITYFGPEDDAWDQETGKPGIALFGSAVQVWAFLNEEAGKSPTVAMAAKAFSVPPQMIMDAIEEHYWMFVTGPDDDFTKMRIEHEGE